MHLILDYPDDDPRKMKFYRFRRSLCDRVITAKEYIALSQHDNNVPPPISLSIPNEEELNSINLHRFLKSLGEQEPHYLTEKRITLNPQNREEEMLFKTMKLLECVRLPRRNWFVGFNGKDKRMFLIERVKWHPKYKLKWTATIEPKAEYNIIYTGPHAQKRLFQYFKDQVRSGREFFYWYSTICYIFFSLPSSVDNIIFFPLYLRAMRLGGVISSTVS